ncbi:MAG: hypothetical protein KF824_05900 [Fimbriimonadaceae bacterium]|nr:MAG: hypothetical protein KF824_05900 [Fimbriimonadaceae bacterium]
MSLGVLENKLVITRTVLENGNVVWEEKTTQDKKSTWLDRREFSSAGSLVSQNINWDLEGQGVSSWVVETNEEGGKAKTLKYRGDSQNLVENYGKEILLGDPSLLWWMGSERPTIGMKASGSLFIPLNGLNKFEVEYVKDVQIAVKGKNYNSHKLVKKLGIRNETWWVDDKGLPLLRYFWSKDENSPHRIDEVQ